MKRILVAASLFAGVIMASCGEPKETTTNSSDSTMTNAASGSMDSSMSAQPDTTRPDTTRQPQ